MNRFHHYSEQWLEWITMASWQLALFVGLVAIVCWSLRKSSARFRHALWLLVLVKVFLSPALTASWSLGNLAAVTSLRENLTAPLVSMETDSPATEALLTNAELLADSRDGTPVEPPQRPLASPAFFSPPSFLTARWLAFVWLVGSITFLSVVVGRYRNLVYRLASGKGIDEGPVRVILEQLALELNLRQTPDLYSTDECSSPLLLGVFRPKIILPQTMCEELSEDQLRTVILHELIHHKHHDLWIGWIQIVAQGLFWFHPLVWWANQKIRHERECVCDEAVLRLGHCTPQSYGEAIVQVLTAARGRSLVTGNMVGIFERGSHLQNRMEEIMSYAANKKRFGWLSRAAVLCFAALFLPMAPQAGVSEEVATNGAVAEAPSSLAETPVQSQGQWPRVIATSPQIGETGVVTSVNEITVTFDRDMLTGMSWTGGPPEFPPTDESQKAKWKDKRTCVLPVKLSRGKIYRVGINSKSFNNFKSADGESALHTAIFFTTEGASRSVERQVQVPQIVEIEPANHTEDVDPKTRTLRVTFDMPMGEGMSWCGGGSNFPTIDESRKSRWSKSGRSCILPVKLEPGKTYQIGLNSLHHINFQSKWGVPLAPVVYEFTISGQAVSGSSAAIEAEATSAVWTPPENPDPRAIRKEAQDDVKAGRYEIALQKHVWYHENAVRLRPSQSAVRLSFALGEWLEFGEIYPPALEEMERFRDAAEKRIRDPDQIRVRSDDFSEFAALNRTLREEEKTVEVFRWLDETEPRDAKRIFSHAKRPLVQQKAYDLYGKYIDPERDANFLKDVYALDHKRDTERFSESTQRMIQESHESMFRNNAATLVAVLVQIDREAEAMEIAKELENFLEDAELKEKLHRQLESALTGEFPKSR